MKFVLYLDRKGEHRWKLVGRNGRILADCGEGYKRRFDRDRAIRLMRADVPGAKVVDPALGRRAI